MSGDALCGACLSELEQGVVEELRPMLVRDDPWIGRERSEAEFAPRKFRRILDAAKCGELAVNRLGGGKSGRPVVRRSELDRGIESHRIEEDRHVTSARECNPWRRTAVSAEPARRL
jgi:hypothetical protein